MAAPVLHIYAYIYIYIGIRTDKPKNTKDPSDCSLSVAVCIQKFIAVYMW
jgi:hypothetical protein